MRFLVHPNEVTEQELLDAPVVVIGGGVAGLSAAIAAARTHSVLLLTKAWLSDSNTEKAQGGVAAVCSKEDSFEVHAGDTLRVGCGLSHPSRVEHVVQAGPGAVQRLIDWGGQFDRGEGGGLALGMEGGHSQHRVVHAMGDRTGREIQRVLVDRARSEPRIRIFEHTFVLDLLEDDDGAVAGVLVHGRGGYFRVRASTVICATGGAGHAFRETTNPEVATADGHALLYRAGVRLRGMEFVQFHPTTLYIAGSSRVLISEAVRGEGAVLRDRDGVAFLDGLHARGSLAPRDFVSRAVLDRMVSTEDTNVYLDMTHLSPSFVRERFPRIYQVCRSFGIDATRDLVPVAPAAHYVIGGATVDDDGRTSMPGLFAIGEVACSGLHGANRLASNSLLEGLVLGERAGEVAANQCRDPKPAAFGGTAVERQPDRHFNSTDLLNAVQSLMWRKVGLLRDRSGLAEAEDRLATWSHTTSVLADPSPHHWELMNLLQFSSLVSRAAREREESRGVHYREDFPEPDDEHWVADLELHCAGDGGLEVRRVPLNDKGSEDHEQQRGAS